MTTVSIKIGTPATNQSTSFSPGITAYMHKEDAQVLGRIRTCAPCPAVYVLKEDSHVIMNRQWQYYLRAINYNMTVENVYLLLDDHLAFANNTGFSSLSSPDRKDYLFDRTNYTQFVRLDKVRTTSRSSLTGVEEYSLVQGLKNAGSLLQSRQRSLRAVRKALVTTNVLNVKTFDSRFAPPLKPGRIYPTKMSEVNPDDYLYMPQYNREMFLVANVVNARGEVVQFPRGGLYSWTQDNTPYSFLPHISHYGYGAVRYDLNKLLKLSASSPVPRPYRSN